MISPEDSIQIQQAVDLLKEEQLVAIPTETVYGLAGNAFSEKAILSIFEVKNRPAVNPLIVHIKNIEAVHEVAQNIPQEALLLAQKYWPGPLTLILEKKDHISNSISAGKTTIGVRVPNHEITLELLNRLNFPIVAPSANRSNHISPTTPAHVRSSLGDRAPFVLEGGSCKNGIESTIVGFKDDQVVLYRHGAIAKEELEDTLQKKLIEFTKDTIAPASPGMFKKHYSPNTPLILTTDLQKELVAHRNQKVGVIPFQNLLSSHPKEWQRVLSTTGNLSEAAANLYRALHEMDSLNLDLIVVEKAPSIGLGVAINDRLERASVQ